MKFIQPCLLALLLITVTPARSQNNPEFPPMPPKPSQSPSDFISELLTGVFDVFMSSADGLVPIPKKDRIFRPMRKSLPVRLEPVETLLDEGKSEED